MQFEAGQLYHIYNRGNYNQQIFFSDRDYLLFIERMKRSFVNRCDLLAYCLMPNHFHFIVHANHNSILATPNSSIPMQHLTDGIRILLSGHSKYINERSRRAGNLFQQKTKSKCISVKDNNYALVAFHYTHQNPFKAGLVQRMEDWKFSSFHDYFENRSDSICNLKLAIELLNIEMSHFYEDSYHEIAEEKLKLIL